MIPATKDLLRKVLLRQEGFRSHPYTDSTGHLTVGIGRNLIDRGISLAEAYIMLDNDISWFDEQLRKNLYFYRSLSEVRQAVLLDMCFNIGLKGFLDFKNMLSAIKSGDYQKAAGCMLDSLWSKQVGKRAQDLAHAMITDVMN